LLFVVTMRGGPALLCALVAACNLGDRTGASTGSNSDLGPSTTCSGVCHGAGDSSAPPRDTAGRSNLSAIGVGAHQQHLTASPWHATFDCVTCHKVPKEVGDIGHIFDLGANGQLVRKSLPADVIFSGLGVGASWDHGSATCSGSYCHGDTLHQTDPATSSIIPGAGGTLTKPVWTTVDGTQSQCGSCHGLPPPAPHPQNQDCGLCHQDMNPGDFAAGKFSYPSFHINGKVEVTTTAACDSCHGGGGLASPPRDAHGNTATTAPGVGAHAQHMTGGATWHAQIACNECHLVPGSTTDQTHLDGIDEVYLDPTIQIPGSPSGTGGHLQVAGATWDAQSLTCANTYCHGGGNSPLSGGTATTPLWTKVDGTQSKCQSCHGMPPTTYKVGSQTLNHPQDTDCGKCHPTMTAGIPGNTTITYPALHINGTVDTIPGTTDQCNHCHGNATATPVNGDSIVNAPPVDTQGNSATNFRGVGAHAAHMSGSTWRANIACGECHAVPTSLLAIGHVDHPLPAYVMFGNLAGATASWNGSTCSNVYCHGATLKDGAASAGGTATQPVWTLVNGSQSQCGSCHGLPPPAPHPQETDCGQCHAPTMIAGQPGVIANAATHIDGNLDVTTNQPCNQCHGSAGTPSSNSAAINAPPKDSLGNTATTARGVGAHQAHLNPATQRFAAVQCSDCHTVPATVNSVGHIDHPLPAYVKFSQRAGSSPTWNGAQCSNVYCHGATLTDGATGAGGAATSPLWTKVDGTQAQCTSCHGNPPPAPHPQNADCGSCHPDVQAGSPTVFSNPAQHVDGTVQVNTSQACNSCHGNHGTATTTGADPANAPPFDSTGTGSATTLRGVGAHQAHLTANPTWHAPVTCGECHVVFSQVSQAGHIDHPLPATMTFTGLAQGTTWNGSTCSAYCHGSTLASGGGAATAPVWTKVDGTQSQCTSCHGNPPPAPHPQGTSVSDCGSCHADVVKGSPTTFATPSQHIDGTVQVTNVHPAGYNLVTAHGYDFDQNGPSTCATASCHGTTLAGGNTGGPSCSSVTGCHDKVGSGYTWQTQCTFCHGDITNPAGNGAPPQGVEGGTLATDNHVGAHQLHVGATAMHAAWDCTTCHTKPTTALSPGHILGNGAISAPVIFGSLNPSATYSASAFTCGTTYCHSNAITNGTSPAWTSTTALACVDGCHGGDPSRTGMSSEHRNAHSGYACVTCHAATVDATGATIVNVALHVNGVKDVKFSGTNGSSAAGTYNNATKSCTNPGCHGTRTW
jgi:predicted CxxxxCH...CXXCH cytochrome family protein